MAPLILPFFHPAFWVLHYQMQALKALETHNEIHSVGIDNT